MKNYYYYSLLITMHVLLASSLIVGSTHLSFATPPYPYDERDLSVLSEIIKLNEINVTPLTLGDQIWRDGRLISLKIKAQETTIRQLPESIGHLTELQELYLSYHHLEELPETIGLLAKLAILHLNANNIKQVPESIGYLGRLQELRLDSNKINILPLTLGQLQKLRNLYINKNPLSGIPDCVITLPNLNNLYY